MVIGGYQWLSVVISDTEKYFLLMTMVIMVIDGYRWLFMVTSGYLSITTAKT